MKRLGLDFGHCEVAVSYTMEGKKPENLVLDNNKLKVIPSQISFTKEQIDVLSNSKQSDWDYAYFQRLGEFFIGDEAQPKNNEDSDEVNLMYFKKAPAFFEDIFEGAAPHGAIMGAYVYKLINQILDYNPDYLSEADRGNIELLVGCPTTEEWTSDEAVRIYGDLIKKATKVASVQIVPESRAAMFSSIESAQTGVSAAGGALVFDLGSSTADCTYMLLGRRCMEFSWRLGAQAIEGEMANMAFEGQNPTLASRVFVTNQLRKMKELYYSGNIGNKGQRVMYDVIDEDGEDIEANLRIRAESMNEAVDGENHEIEIVCDSKDVLVGTWKNLCYLFFKQAKERLDKENLPYSDIVITGGASKMDFVESSCREVFGDGVQIHLEKNPSFSVANGLGWVSCIDSRIPDVIEKSKEDMKTKLDEANKTLRDNISERIRQILSVIIFEQAQLFAERETDASAQELVNDIITVFNAEQQKETIKSIIENEFSIWGKNFNEAVKDVANNHSADLMSAKISKGVLITDRIWEEFDLKNLISSSLDAEKILQTFDFNKMLSDIFNGFVGWILFFIAVVAFGPVIGIVVGYALMAIVNHLNKSRFMSQALNKEKRQRLHKGIKSKIDDKKLTVKIDEYLLEALKPFLNSQDALVDIALKETYDVVVLKKFAD